MVYWTVQWWIWLLDGESLIGFFNGKCLNMIVQWLIWFFKGECLKVLFNDDCLIGYCSMVDIWFDFEWFNGLVSNWPENRKPMLVILVPNNLLRFYAVFLLHTFWSYLGIRPSNRISWITNQYLSIFPHEST